MRHLIMTALLLALCLLTACHSHPTCKSCPAMNSQIKPVYRHVVAFKFKPTASDAQIKEIVDGFAELPKKIDTIIAYEHGINISKEGHDQGFTHVFIVTFKDQAGLEVYLPHPAHKAFVEKLLPLLDQPFVVDFVTE